MYTLSATAVSRYDLAPTALIAEQVACQRAARNTGLFDPSEGAHGFSGVANPPDDCRLRSGLAPDGVTRITIPRAMDETPRAR